MAYASKHLRKVLDFGGTVGGAMYVYDTADAVATVYAAGYITDAGSKGLRKGDLVLHRRWTTAVPAADSEVKTAAGSANIFLGMTWMVVMGLTASGNEYTADLSDGTAVSVTNT